MKVYVPYCKTVLFYFYYTRKTQGIILRMRDLKCQVPRSFKVFHNLHNFLYLNVKSMKK